MNSIKFFYWSFTALFLSSLFVFFFFLGWERFSYMGLVKSVLITLPPVIYLSIRSKRINWRDSVIGVYTNTTPIAAALVFAVVVFSLVVVDLDSFRITRDHARQEDVYMRLINLHIVLVLLVCIYKFSSKNMGIDKGGVQLMLCLALSLSIALLEGRRTSILMPVLLVSLFSMSAINNTGQLIRRGGGFLFLFLGLFIVVTSIRSPNLADMELLFRAILSRLFNPGHMMLEVFTQGDLGFQPQTSDKIIERLGYIFGLNSYRGTTNDFGIYYGFLSASNKSVGINPGLLVESFLSFSWLFMIPVILIFEFGFIVMRLYQKLLFRGDLFVAILIIHGMQMEMPYTVGLLVKLYVVGVFLYIMSFLLPKKRIYNAV